MGKASASLIPAERSILFLRGQKVMLDSDLASLYGVETRALNQAVNPAARMGVRRKPHAFTEQGE